RAGVSTFSFIKSSSVVPPATKRTSAPCCAVFACAAVATAAVESVARSNSKVCMGLLLLSTRVTVQGSGFKVQGLTDGGNVELGTGTRNVLFVCSSILSTNKSGLSVFANLLDRGDDIGVDSAAADVAAHQFLHVRVVGTAGFFKQRHRRHDLAGRAISALVTIASKECRLHGM